MIHLTKTYEKGKLKWSYLLPEGEEDYAVLSKLCGRCLEFENHYLLCYKAYLVNELCSEDESRKRFALQRLRQVIYRDNEILDTLQSMEKSCNEEIWPELEETLRLIISARGFP